MGPSNLGDNRSEVFVPVAEESALRQTRWQKVIYPNKITRKLSIGFKPYTLVATLGPSQYAERPMGPYMGVQSLDALQLG